MAKDWEVQHAERIPQFITRDRTGAVVNLNDLPSKGFGMLKSERWVPAMKLAVLAAIDLEIANPGKGVTLEQAKSLWFLSREEVDEWRKNLALFGVPGLNVDLKRDAISYALEPRGMRDLPFRCQQSDWAPEVARCF